MRTKLLILPVVMMMGLAVSAPVSADTTDPTRVEIEAQGNQKINALWSQYQQALQEREDAWEQGQGNRYSEAYMTADAKAGAIYQEWLRAQTQLGDDLHNYDVSQWQKEQDQQQADQPSQQPQQTQPVTTTQSSQISAEQPQTEVTKTDQPQTKASAVQFNQSANVEAKSTTHNPQQATTSRTSAKPANLSSQVKKPAQSNTAQNDQQTKLPQTGNSNLLTVVGILLFAFLGILIGVWKFFDARRGGKR
ncbi:LPXTG cell wall anchor domain-containing protein [Limosilactobacillus reuteri]|uniref:LPXTG cell wall anchor domain-containing protein n=1 Tax=Limosilactobacillus reuteri TaxID=1598 RepID=UPI001583F851|nr:LPXTG cell wall anchor domain-containing protein [Limosilactobacillus reuteri]QKT14976.1 LPXTG cell wall anchor domain-containing protein [Limosilactobacillus reuteri]